MTHRSYLFLQFNLVFFHRNILPRNFDLLPFQLTTIGQIYLSCSPITAVVHVALVSAGNLFLHLFSANLTWTHSLPCIHFFLHSILRSFPYSTGVLSSAPSFRNFREQHPSLISNSVVEDFAATITHWYCFCYISVSISVCLCICSFVRLMCFGWWPSAALSPDTPASEAIRWRMMMCGKMPALVLAPAALTSLLLILRLFHLLLRSFIFQALNYCWCWLFVEMVPYTGNGRSRNSVQRKLQQRIKQPLRPRVIASYWSIYLPGPLEAYSVCSWRNQYTISEFVSRRLRTSVSLSVFLSLLVLLQVLLCPTFIAHVHVFSLIQRKWRTKLGAAAASNQRHLWNAKADLFKSESKSPTMVEIKRRLMKIIYLS